MTGGLESDVDLLMAWRAGDERAGNELVRRHFDSVYEFFRNKVPDGVEDLTQKTFLGCVEARERIRVDASFRAYLFGIARKQLLRRWENLKRDGRTQQYESVSARRSSPSLVFAREEEQQVIALAITRLPLELQITIELLYWEELSVAEIAVATEVPAGTVKSRLFRARKLLRETIEAMQQISPDLRQTTITGLDGLHGLDGLDDGGSAD